jgi:hypothetical protein
VRDEVRADASSGFFASLAHRFAVRIAKIFS